MCSSRFHSFSVRGLCAPKGVFTGRRGAFVLVLLLVSAPALFAQAVLTRSYDNLRSGSNAGEKNLTPANANSLNKLRELALDTDDDPRIEAQPLYVPQLRMTDGQQHDVVIVCTMADNVYAFDVNNGAKLWKVSVGTPITPKITGTTQFGQKATEIDLWGINLRWGILSTPVIDIDTKTLYVVSWSSSDGTRNNAVHQLHALNLVTGQPTHAPLVIQADAGPNAHFDSTQQKQRAALLLTPLRQPAGAHVKKTLFVAFAQTDEDSTSTHGWVMAFDVDTFRQAASWCTTPGTFGGGIWQAGQGPATADLGYIYVMTGNGRWQDSADFPESFIRLQYAAGALKVKDWFNPFRDDQRPKNGPNGYDFTDQDLGAAGPILPPGTNLAVGAGKDGVLYAFDRGNLGGKSVDQTKPALADNKPLLSAVFFTYFPGTFALNPLVNVNDFPDGKTHHLHGSAVAWDSGSHGTMLFVWGENAPLRAWTLNASGQPTFLAESQETASAFSTIYNAMPGGMITLSANGGQEGLVWGSVPVKGNWQGRDNDGNANQQIVEGVIRAYDASTFDGTNENGNPRMKLLWQSTSPGNPQPGDTRFTYDKFCPPVVADGKVLLATYDGRVIVYGH
jgi:outer membrane protein assembly factor BamB